MEEKKPFVSVVIPNYNHAKYLKERMDSILNQTYQNFEIIILDDCSSDNSKEVIAKYKDNPHVSHIVFNENNSGKVFSQWQKGFGLAKGELIWISESDDKCLPTLLEELVKEFEYDSTLALAFTRTMYFNDKGIINVAYGDIKNNNKECLSGKRFINKYMAEGCYVTNASSAVFKKISL